MSLFRDKLLDRRIAEAQRVRALHPSYVPVIAEAGRRYEKIIADSQMTVGELSSQVVSKLADCSLPLLFDDGPLDQSVLLVAVDARHRARDGFVYARCAPRLQQPEARDPAEAVVGLAPMSLVLGALVGVCLFATPAAHSAWRRLYLALGKALSRAARFLRVVPRPAACPACTEQSHATEQSHVRCAGSFGASGVGLFDASDACTAGARAAAAATAPVAEATAVDGGDPVASTGIEAAASAMLYAAPDGDDDSTQCVVCLDAPRTRALVPCGHCCACEACHTTIRACPLCRTPVERTLRVYW